MKTGRVAWPRAVEWVGCAVLAVLLVAPSSAIAQTGPVVHDAHFHLTNDIQEGTDIRDFLKCAPGRRPA